MQFSSLLSRLLILGVATLAAAQQLTITSIDPTKASQVLSDLGAYITSVAADPQYTSLQQVIATASGIPGNLDFMDAGKGESIINEVITGSPSWLSALPTPQQSYIKSIFAAEVSIINKDVGSGAAPSRGVGGVPVLAMGLALSFGVAAVLML